MTVKRSGQSGETLIEMLAALAVSALIGLAGFTLLESVLRTEAGLADHMDQLTRQDRAFQLLALDLQQAHYFEMKESDSLTLHALTHTVLWQGSASGLIRRIAFDGRPDVVQQILGDTVQIKTERNTSPLVMLLLPEHDILRVFHAPREARP